MQHTSCFITHCLSSQRLQIGHVTFLPIPWKCNRQTAQMRSPYMRLALPAFLGSLDQSLHHSKTRKMNMNADHSGPRPLGCGPGQPSLGVCLSHVDPEDPSNLSVIFHLAMYRGQLQQKASTAACRFWVLQYLLSETAQLLTLVTQSNYQNSKISYCTQSLSFPGTNGSKKCCRKSSLMKNRSCLTSSYAMLHRTDQNQKLWASKTSSVPSIQTRLNASDPSGSPEINLVNQLKQALA